MACTAPTAGQVAFGCCKDADGCMGVMIGTSFWGFYPAPFPPAPNGIERYRRVRWHWELSPINDAFPGDPIPDCPGVDDYDCTMDTWTGVITCTGTPGTNYRNCSRHLATLFGKNVVETKTTYDGETWQRYGPDNQHIQESKVGSIHGEVYDRIDEADEWVQFMLKALHDAPFPNRLCVWDQYTMTNGVLSAQPSIDKGLPCPPAPNGPGEILPFNAGALLKISSLGVVAAPNPTNPETYPWYSRWPVEISFQKIKCHKTRMGCRSDYMGVIELDNARLVNCASQLGSPSANQALGVIAEPYVAFNLFQPESAPNSVVARSSSYIHWSDSYLADIVRPVHRTEIRNCCGQDDNPAP